MSFIETSSQRISSSALPAGTISCSLTCVWSVTPLTSQFGIAQVLKSDDELLRTVAGSPGYAAPEVLTQENRDEFWPVSKMLAANEPVMVDGLSGRIIALPAGPWNKCPQSARLVPLL